MTKLKQRKVLKWILIIAAIVAVGVIGGLIAVVIGIQQFAATDKIAPHVTVSGVPVGGLTQPQAIATLQQQLLPRLPVEVELEYPGGSYAVPPQQLGATVMLQDAVAQAYRLGRVGPLVDKLVTYLRLRRAGVDIAVRVRVDEQRLHTALIELVDEINREPRNAQVKVVDDQVEIEPGQTGVSLQIAASLAALRVALSDPWCRRVELCVEVQPPPIAPEDLANIEVVLSSYSTPFNPAKVGRTHNLELGMGHINETVLQPGEEFSLNETVGPRLAKEGYRSADIFREGEVVPETGGGVCQVTTTVYNAALLANLEILERHHHSRPVVYCPAGRDATVYYGQIDMRFRNTLSHPILILGGREGNRLWAKILGKTEDDYDVKLVRTGVSRFGFGVKEIEDSQLPAGTREVETPGRGGTRATLFREVYRDGELIKRERMHSDVYPAQTEIVRVGTQPVQPVPGPSLAPWAPELPPVEMPPGVETGALQ